MSRAVQCDFCDGFAQPCDAIEIVQVRTFPRPEDPDHIQGFGSEDETLDICRECLDRPLRELLQGLCIGIQLPKASDAGAEVTS